MASGEEPPHSRDARDATPDSGTTRDLTTSTERLRLLHEILGELNSLTDVREALDRVLARIVEALDLSTGWIVLRNEASTDALAGEGFALAAHVNLPPALSLDRLSVWQGLCNCERSCAAGGLHGARNIAHCPRLDGVPTKGGHQAAHASAPLSLDGAHLGMLNVADEDWRPLDADRIKVLEAVGRQLGQAMGRSGVHERMLAARVREQATLLDLSRHILAARSLDDVVTHLLECARETLEVDAGVLLLPDGQDQHLRFTGAVGWSDDPAAAGRRIPPGMPCGAAVSMRTRQPLVIEDLLAEPIAALSLPWIRREAFRAYLAVPLLGREDAVGALVVNSRAPRTFKDHETRYLQLLANTAALAIETDLLKKRAAKSQRMQRELDLARGIQRTMVPPPELDLSGWDVATSYESAQEIGGDFFDVIELPGTPRRLCLVLGDVAGKSISGALLMASTIGAIREAIHVNPDPVAVLTTANARLRRHIRRDRFVTAFCGVLDVETGRLRYASAGHNAPIVARAGSDRVEELAIGGTALGIFDDPGLHPREAELHPGDTLLVYTDGVTEALDAGNEMFGDDRLFETVAATHVLGPAALRDALLKRLHGFRHGAGPSDDVTLLVVHREA